MQPHAIHSVSEALDDRRILNRVLDELTKCYVSRMCGRNLVKNAEARRPQTVISEDVLPERFQAVPDMMHCLIRTTYGK